MNLAQLNKVNYPSDPRNYVKAESGQCIGRWQEYQSHPNLQFDPARPYFVVCGDAGGVLPYFVVVDLDVITPAKLADDEKKPAKRQKYRYLPVIIRKRIQACAVFLPPDQLLPTFLQEMGLPAKMVVIRSGSGGLHLYIFVNDKGKLLSNKTLRRYYENLAVDFRAKGGLIYGIGTWWKDYPAPYTILHDGEITPVAGWRVAYVAGCLNYGVCGVSIEDFLTGKLDLHAANLGSEKEFIVWREAMYVLKQLGYDQDGVFQIFSHLPCFDPAKSKNQIAAWWDKEENDPRRVRAKELRPGEKPPDTVESSRELDIEDLFDQLEDTDAKTPERGQAVGQLLRKIAKTSDHLTTNEYLVRLKDITGYGLVNLKKEIQEYQRGKIVNTNEVMNQIHADILQNFTLKYDVPCERLHVWDTHAWGTQGENLIETFFKNRWVELTGNLPSKTDYVNILKNISVDERVTWRHPPNQPVWNLCDVVIPCQNGYINVQTRAIVPPDPTKYFTYYIHEDYNPTAICPDTLVFLSNVLTKEDVETVQRYAGYSLVAFVKFKKCIVFKGPHNTGKSTIIDIFRYALGQELTAELQPQKLGERFAEAILEGKLIGFYNDMEKNMLKNIGRFKVVVDSSDVNYEDKNIKAHMGRNVTHYWYAGNVLPKIPADEGTDSVDAFLERIMLILCNNQWDGEKQDIAAQLVAKERQGILAWMVEGAFKLFAEKGDFKHTQQHSLIEWLAGSIAVAKFFVDQYEYDSDGQVLVLDLYEECNTWLRAHNEIPYPDEGSFGKETKLIGLQHRRRLKLGSKELKYYYVGLTKKQPKSHEDKEIDATILKPPDDIVRETIVVEQIAKYNTEVAQLLAKQQAHPDEISVSNVYAFIVEKGLLNTQQKSGNL